MRLTRRWLLGLFGAAAAAPVLPKVAVAEEAPLDILLFPPGPYVPPRGEHGSVTIITKVPARFFWNNPGSLYSDELTRILKEQVGPLVKFKVEE